MMSRLLGSISGAFGVFSVVHAVLSKYISMYGHYGTKITIEHAIEKAA